MVPFWAFSGGVQAAVLFAIWTREKEPKTNRRGPNTWQGEVRDCSECPFKGPRVRRNTVLEYFCLAYGYFAATGGIHQVILMRQMAETLETALRLPEEPVQS